jgi:hypothetical protein
VTVREPAWQAAGPRAGGGSRLGGAADEATARTSKGHAKRRIRQWQDSPYLKARLASARRQLKVRS